MIPTYTGRNEQQEFPKKSFSNSLFPFCDIGFVADMECGELSDDHAVGRYYARLGGGGHWVPR